MKLLILLCLTSQIFSVHASELLCPEGSICTQDQLNVYKELNVAFVGTSPQKKALFIKKMGFPIKFLVTKDFYQKKGLVAWNSRCEHHKKDKKPFWFKAEDFTRKLTSSPEQLYPTAQVGDKKFLIPYDSTPIYIEDNKLIFLFDVLENYFELSIDSLGHVSFHQTKIENSPPIPENTTCSEDKNKSSRPEFLFSICQKLWDKNLKRFEMVQFDWGCP